MGTRGGLGRRRRLTDWATHGSLWALSWTPALLLSAMLATLVLRSGPILQETRFTELILGTTWQPLQGKFGFAPFVAGTLWVTAVAMCLATPPSLLMATYLTEYASPALRALASPLLDLLASIPSVVYGVWGVVAVVPWVRHSLVPLAERAAQGIPFLAVHSRTGYSILAGGIVLAIMVTPLIVSVSASVMAAVPMGLREAALSLGATRWEAVRLVVYRKALPGLAAAVMLGFSRAFGETMAVLMVVGNLPRIPSSIFDPAYPLTALIANNFGEMLSIPRYDAALTAASLLLLVVVLAFNLGSALFLRRISRWSGT